MALARASITSRVEAKIVLMLSMMLRIDRSSSSTCLEKIVVQRVVEFLKYPSKDSK